MRAAVSAAAAWRSARNSAAAATCWLFCASRACAATRRSSSSFAFGGERGVTKEQAVWVFGGRAGLN
jgi:hypothetical protein